MVHPFGLQSLEKAFSYRIVIAIPFAAHALATSGYLNNRHLNSLQAYWTPRSEWKISGPLTG